MKSMKFDLHVHVNPKEHDTRKALTGIERLFIPSLVYYAVKKTFPDWFITGTIGSESIIFPKYVKEYKDKGIIVPVLDHDDNNYQARWELANNLGIPYGGEFSVKIENKTAHILVIGDTDSFDTDMYKRLIGLDMKEFLSRIKDYKKEHKLIVSWAHPFAKTNRDGIPATEELIKEFPYAVELNTTHPNESLTLLKILSGEKKHITVGSDSHDPQTIGEAYTEAESFDELLDYYHSGKHDINYESDPEGDIIYIDNPHREIMFEKPMDVANRILRIKNYYFDKIKNVLREDDRVYDLPVKLLLRIGFEDFLDDAIYGGVKKYFDGSYEQILNGVKEKL